jgi:WXG100 family type VII secretion target
MPEVNSLKYDSEDIRSVARRLKNCASSVSGLSTRDLRQVRERMEAEFKGEAADALNERLSEFQRDVGKIAEGLEAISSELTAYARRVELADAANKANIQSR